MRFSDSGRVCICVVSWRVAGDRYGLWAACEMVGKVFWATELRVETS